MAEVSLLRLYVMRAFYLLLVLGVGSMAVPTLTRPALLDPLDAVAFSFWGALALLAVIGLRYPLQMVPLIMVQLVYKTIWLLAVAVPLWRTGAPFDPETTGFTRAMAIGVALDLLVMPWGYVYAHYLRRPGDRWTIRRGDASS